MDAWFISLAIDANLLLLKQALTSGGVFMQSFPSSFLPPYEGNEEREHTTTVLQFNEPK